MAIDKMQFCELKEIEACQVEAIRKTLVYCQRNSPYYRRLFDKYDFVPAQFAQLQDLSTLPPTSKEDLQRQSGDFLCVPRKKLTDYSSTSGTLGEPVFIPSTKNDLDRLALNEAISFQNAGVTSNDVIQLMTTMDRRFMAGMAYFLGALKLEAGFVRVGSGVPELQWDTIRAVKPTVIIAVPSFIVKLIEYAEQHSIDVNKTSVKKALCIGESLRNEDFSLNALGQIISEKWNIGLHSTYASTEMRAAFTECTQGLGGHLIPEVTYAEVLKEDGTPVGNGESGEVVFTSIGVEALPLIRYRTGDVCTLIEDPCSCGRKTMRLGPILGRKQQMIKYKGTSIYPAAIFNALNHFREIENYVVEVSASSLTTDEVLIRAGVTQPSEELMKKITDNLQSRLRVSLKIEFTDQQELMKIQAPEKNRKPVKFIDKR